jgi:hypothetical protein
MMSQDRKPGFDALPDGRQAALSLSGILFGDQQTIVGFEQFILQARAAIAQITDDRLGGTKLRQTFRNRPVGIVGRRQNNVANLLFRGRQHVQLEPEEPALRRLSEIGPGVSQKPDSGMPRRQTQRNRVGVQQIQLALVKRGRLHKEPFDDSRQSVQTADKLLVTAQRGKLGAKVLGNQTIGFVQTFDPELRLHQRDGQDFRVGERRPAMIAAPPVGNLRILFQKIINEAVDFTQFIKYLGHWLSFRANRFSWSIIYFTPLYSDNLLFFK